MEPIINREEECEISYDKGVALARREKNSDEDKVVRRKAEIRRYDACLVDLTRIRDEGNRKKGVKKGMGKSEEIGEEGDRRGGEGKKQLWQGNEGIQRKPSA